MTFHDKHNKHLNKWQSEKAAAQANAILKKTGDEGLAIAVANKNAKKDEPEARHNASEEKKEK